MIADCPGCAPPKPGSRGRSGARAKLRWLALLPAVLYAVAPKCPLCLVAYLSAFGVTVGVAGFFLSVLPPLAVVSALLGLGFALWRAREGPELTGPTGRVRPADGGIPATVSSSTSSIHR